MQRKTNYKHMLSNNVKLSHGWKKINENNRANLNEGIREFFPRGNEDENFMKIPLVRGLRGHLG